MAGEAGIEPTLTESKSVVLPLYDTPIINFALYLDGTKTVLQAE